jgi:hypothetical protein
VAQPKKGGRKRVSTLKPVGIGPDGGSILLARSATAASGSFRLAIDEALVEALEEAHAARAARARAAIEEDAGVPQPEPAKVESKLSIKEIQSLLRQGRSVEAIARKAGVEPDWVHRWEVPIQWERSGTATRAQRVHLRRARGGVSRVPLAEAVVANLKERGIRLDVAAFDAGWDSTKRPRSARWIVTFTFTARRSEQVARWEFDPESGDLTALDKLANELGWIAPLRRRSRA